MAIDVTISKAYLKDVDDSNHKVPHYMAVSEVIGAGGKVAVTHFRCVRKGRDFSVCASSNWFPGTRLDRLAALELHATISNTFAFVAFIGRYSDLYALHSRLAQDAANAPLPRFPERSKYDVLMRVCSCQLCCARPRPGCASCQCNI